MTTRSNWWLVKRWLVNRATLTAVLIAAVLIAARALPVRVAWADDAKPSSTIDSALFKALEAADDEPSARVIESAIWEFWFDQSPSSVVRKSMDAGMERRQAYDFEAAEQHFSQAVEAAPDYAEAYNQRAFIRFLRENYEQSMVDLEKALELEPRHFGAMAGLYQILVRQNRFDAAMGMLREAVTIHPWLRERSGLPESYWPDRYRYLQERKRGI